MKAIFIYKRNLLVEIFEYKNVILAHGCNAQGKMGSGFANGFKKLFPDDYRKYLYACETESKKDLLGSTIWGDGDSNVITANCITQLYYGNDRKRYIDYDAYSKCLEEVFTKSRQTNRHVCMPDIGTGLAGGDPVILHDILQKQINKVHPTAVYVYKL